jgi:hypothetical protein
MPKMPLKNALLSKTPTVSAAQCHSPQISHELRRVGDWAQSAAGGRQTSSKRATNGGDRALSTNFSVCQNHKKMLESLNIANPSLAFRKYYKMNFTIFVRLNFQLGSNGPN